MSRNKRAKHSKASLYPLFDEYAKSEEGRRSFCNRHCIGLHNYNYWWAKYRKEKGLSSLSKNKGRKKVKSTSTALENSPQELPTTISSFSSHETGGFIKIEGEGYASHQNGRLALRTPQGVELSFESLPPVSYLQQLLNLVQQP